MLNKSDSIETYSTTNLSLAFTNLLPGIYSISLLWALNAGHRLAVEVDPSKGSRGKSTQLVWNLRDPPTEVNVTALDRLTKSRSLKISQVIAPPKARSQLGVDVHLMTVSEESQNSSPAELEDLV